MARTLADRLRRISTEEQILENERMSAHTTMRVGGPADVFYMPSSAEELLEGLRICREEGAPAVVVGYGSNLIVRDGGVRGAVIALNERFGCVEREGNALIAQAGAKLSRLSQAAAAAGLSGAEFAGGIPGSVGGGVAMNAGAYGGEIAQVFESAEVYISGRVETISAAEMGFGYRTSLPLREGGTVLSARFLLTPGRAEEIRARVRELNGRRRDKQPLEYASAGSTFRRPEGYFAGALIEQAGLKGFAVGGARVSEKHAGFVINDGAATASDVLAVIEAVRARVLETSGVTLEPEVRVIGSEMRT